MNHTNAIIQLNGFTVLSTICSIKRTTVNTALLPPSAVPICSRNPTYLCCLFLKGIQDAVDQLLLQPGIDVRSSEVGHDLVDCFHDHLTILFCLVLQIVHHAPNDLCGSHFGRNLNSRVDQLHQQIYQKKSKFLCKILFKCNKY